MMQKCVNTSVFFFLGVHREFGEAYVGALKPEHASQYFRHRDANEGEVKAGGGGENTGECHEAIASSQ